MSFVKRSLSRVAYGAAPILCFGLPFLAAFSFIFNHFFSAGAFFFDSGFFADLMWHKGWGLPNPAVSLVAPEFPPHSYYGIHFSPLLAIISQIAWPLPVDQVDIFATYMGLAHGLLGLVMWRLLMKLSFERSAAWAAISAVLSIAFAMNGLALSVTIYPHIEILIPPLLIITFYLLLEERFLAACLVGGLSLLIREDVGFHFFAVASLVIFLNWWRGKGLSSQRALCLFATSAFAYSCIAIAVQDHFSAPQSTFSWVYAGDPAFAHLTPTFIANRLSNLLIHRPYIWLPLLMVCISAIVLKNWYALVGVAAVLPWLLLHLLAVTEWAGTLWIHYTFPIVIGVGWSILALVHDSRQGARRQAALVKVLSIAGITASTFVGNPAAVAFFGGVVPTEFALKPQRTRDFMNALGGSLPLLGRLRADSGVISLRPRLFTPAGWLLPRYWNSHGRPSRDIKTLVYFNRSFEPAMALAQLGEMNNARLFKVPDTNIMIAISGDLSATAPITPFLHRVPDPPRRTGPLYIGFDVEPSMRWGRDRSPYVSLVKCAAKNVRLEIIGYATWPKNEQSSSVPGVLRVEVTVNDKPERTLEFTPTTRQQFVELPVVCVNDEMVVRFNYDYLIAPSEDGRSKDTRKLGIGIVGDPTFN